MAPAASRAAAARERGEAAALATSRGWSFDVLPLVNSLGYDAHTRGHDGCPDLNRELGERPGCPETAAIMRALDSRATLYQCILIP